MMAKTPQRPTREGAEPKPTSDPCWWGMPSFEMGDARPMKKLQINFLTMQDFHDFCSKLGISVPEKTKSIWHPAQESIRGEFRWDGPKVSTRYPVCIPSKGRWDCQKTGRVLDEMGVEYRFFVEETEADKYREHVGEEHVVSMPFHDLGQGSIPARNFIWDWSLERGHKRHWVVDDNITRFLRCNYNIRLTCKSGAVFRAMEDFVDRYENVAMAGPHANAFVEDRRPVRPITWNSRVYSCILLDTSLPHRWRGRYNEDTDLSIRLLKDGYCTLLFNALLMHKDATVGYMSKRPMKGGNTDTVYNTNDHRRAFAESLREQHPDVVEVVWKFNRWHHQVDYRPFKNNTPILRADVTPTGAPDEYGLTLVRLKGEADE